ncbi:tRNA1(Val) (adenine(37)-N6)-methyltransferase [Desulfoplanes formicivorans]|uniref:Methyltransferase type 11 n=1 Tax=Desulfoplanes formicivorans TaxID=1592317 RepID=A0A194AC52_9BACT|nr:methyltransferase [Desulfoplanes formicivorans]GAU07727.1 methyltransferase type 11 [Desulfoplanes formicivorans]
MTISIEQARNLFPRGLVQPPQGFRFAVDALLASCFARIRKNDRVLDLGTGCGVIGLGLLLHHDLPSVQVVGLDRDPDMVGSARINVAAMGLGERMDIVQGDVREAPRFLRPEWADVVVCNPPYRVTGRGKTCPQDSRTHARFQVSATLDDFLAASACALKNRGRIYLVFLAEGLDVLLGTMRTCRLMPKRVMPVHGRQGAPARLVLVEGRKNGGPGMVLTNPLFLYETGENRNRITPEALGFCPFLACNTGL